MLSLQPRDCAAPMAARRTIDRPHWSYSQVSQFLRCPLRYYFQYVLRLSQPSIPSSLVFGSAVHAALAEYHQRLLMKQPIVPAVIHNAFLEAWATSEQGSPIQYRDREDRDGLLDLGCALIDIYLQEPPPEEILGVEKTLVVPLSNSHGDYLERPLVAVLDLLHRGGGGLTVTEFKTSGRRFNELEAESALQASCYAHAVQEHYGEPASIRYTVLVKTKTPGIQHLDTARSASDLGRLGDVVQAVERAIKAEAFYPVESSMNCSGCPFYRECREWKDSSAAGNEPLETVQLQEV